MNVGSYLDRAAERSPAHPAIVEGDRSIDYDEWRGRAGRVAAVLADAGVRRGDRVALLMPNSSAFLEVLFAVLRMGAVVVPFNTRLHPKECDYLLEHSGSVALVHDPRFASIVAESAAAARVSLLQTPELLAAAATAAPLDAVDADAGDLAWFFYTSGTTGRPKAAMVTHGNLAAMTDLYLADVYDASPNDRALHAGPLTHGSGLWSISLTAAGVTHIVPQSPSFDPAEIFALIERHRVSKLVFLSPTMIKILLESEAAATADCSSLRFVGYGGAPIHPDDLRAALDRWGPVLCNIYGQGECPMTISMLSPAQHAAAMHDGSDHLRSVGTARRGIEVTVRDEHGAVLQSGEIGEICVNGDVVLRGYWQDETATADAFRHGTYHTGDLGTFDDDGYLYLLDRAKELVISGGSNIYPREVENVLVQHPAVAEVAVFGVPDRHWGESVVAAVVASGEEPDRDELLALCRDNLASYKKPRWIVFVDALPRSAYGKVLKRELVDRYRDLADEGAVT
jgi:acyl-CoA synthetase (AMP-forming)/AMP-acid ligase II